MRAQDEDVVGVVDVSSQYSTCERHFSLLFPAGVRVRDEVPCASTRIDGDEEDVDTARAHQHLRRSLLVSGRKCICTVALASGSVGPGRVRDGEERRGAHLLGDADRLVLVVVELVGLEQVRDLLDVTQHALADELHTSTTL